MTEDEAFIRAVVDSPGDDLPRLVYADWLDERGDPRGAYLRAEAEWAQPWRRGERPILSNKLRAMAKSLDATWVARVTRPPMGVCADHVGFTESGALLSPKELDRLERRVEVTFPTELRAFLLNWNGGVPGANRFPHPLLPNFECELQPWFSVGPSPNCKAEHDLAYRIIGNRESRSRTRQNIAPLCAADGGYYEYISIGVRGKARNRVWHDLCEALSEFAPAPVVVARSLSEFLALLTRAPEEPPPVKKTKRPRAKRR
jgi:uncharacterized protein (TIGR02996 family)